MSTLGFTSGKFSENIWGRFIKAVARAVSTYDADSGWISTPANKTFKHDAGVLPKTVLVYASDNADGTGFSTDTATSVTSTLVVFTGPKAYCRVLVNK